MASPDQPKKSGIFDKVPSLGKRKEIFSSTLAEHTQFFCKGVGECLIAFLPSSLNETGWEGKVEIMEGEFRSGESVIVNFSVGNENYFMQTQVFGLAGRATLVFPKELFRLQRRTHVRVEVDGERDQGVNLIRYNGKGVFLSARCLDVSAGGARLSILEGTLPITAGDTLTAVFHLDDRWRFEVNGQIKHVVKQQDLLVFGVQFETSNRSTQNRLQMMMLEMQRSVVGPSEEKSHGSSS